MTRRWSDSKRQKLISYILKFQFIFPRTSARRLQADNTPTVNLPAQPDSRPAATMRVRVCVYVLTWLLFLLFLLPGLVVCVVCLVLVLFSHLSLAFLTLLLAKGAAGRGKRCQLR